jgi:hypothetical protein
MKKEIKMIKKFESFPLKSLKTLFLIMVIIGSIGIFINSLIFGLLYIVFIIFSFLLNIALCKHCPYPCDYNTCLFMSVKFVKKYYKYKSPDMNFIEKFIIVFYLLGYGIIPLFWIYKNIYLLIPFLIIAIYIYSFMLIYICRRCYNYNCPFNRVKKDSN